MGYEPNRDREYPLPHQSAKRAADIMLPTHPAIPPGPGVEWWIKRIRKINGAPQVSVDTRLAEYRAELDGWLKLHAHLDPAERQGFEATISSRCWKLRGAIEKLERVIERTLEA
jgi:hypothetical protein